MEGPSDKFDRFCTEGIIWRMRIVRGCTTVTPVELDNVSPVEYRHALL